MSGESRDLERLCPFELVAQFYPTRKTLQSACAAEVVREVRKGAAEMGHDAQTCEMHGRRVLKTDEKGWGARAVSKRQSVQVL